MEVGNVFTSGSFVQIIDVLGYDLYIKIVFESLDSKMSGIGLFGEQFFSSNVVKIDNQFSVFC